MTPCWQKRRNAFNHDWLKNRFMPALSKWLNLLDDKIEDEEFENKFISSVFCQWQPQREEILTLAQDFELEMSPRRLFVDGPLSGCDKYTRQWLEFLTHNLWLDRYPVRRWITDATECTRKIDALYDQLREELRVCHDIRAAGNLRSLRKQFAEFRDRCQDLARAIEQFPSEVKVT